MKTISEMTNTEVVINGSKHWGYDEYVEPTNDTERDRAAELMDQFQLGFDLAWEAECKISRKQFEQFFGKHSFNGKLNIESLKLYLN